MVEHFVKSKCTQRSSKEWKGERWFDEDIEDEGFINKLKEHEGYNTTMTATIPINDDNTWDCNIKDTNFTNIFQNNIVDLPLFDEVFDRNAEINCSIHLKSIFLVDKQHKMCVCNWEFKNIQILQRTSIFDSINLDAFCSIDDSDDEE